MKLAYLVVAALLAAAPLAHAQSEATVSLGVGFAVTSPTNDAAERDAHPILLLRLRGEPGVGPTVGFGWFASSVRTAIGGNETFLGKVRVRPVMAGASYSRQRGRLSAGVSLEAGYAFAHVSDTGAARREYLRQPGVTDVAISVSDAPAWRASASVWFDLGARYGLVASVGYLGVRPTVTTRSNLATTRERLNLGSVVTSVGIAYGLF